MDTDFDHIDEMSDDDINVIESQTPEVKSKCKKKSVRHRYGSYIREFQKKMGMKELSA